MAGRVVAAVLRPTIPWTPMAVRLGEVDAAAQATEGSCFDGSAGVAAVVLLQLTTVVLLLELYIYIHDCVGWVHL